MNPLTTPNDASTHVLAVVGPTGVGKTDLAEWLALHSQGEIISADSMQVYKGMDIGTAKAPESLRRVPYHCIDLVDPGTSYSAACYQADARRAIRDCASRSVLPVLCGGTGLYVRAALDDFAFPPGDQVHSRTRSEHESLAERAGAPALHALLAEKDPESARLLHPNNVRRVVRALEMLATGQSYAEQAGGFSERRSIYHTTFVGLTMDRSALYERIDARVDAMVDAGLVDEVIALLSAGFRGALTATQAIGYKEIVEVLDGRATLAEATESIKRSTRRYAKRQMTWFRADPRIDWIDVTGMSSEQALEAALIALHWENRTD